MGYLLHFHKGIPFPNGEAARIALETVTSMLENHGCGFDRIIFNIFKDLHKRIYEELL